MTTECVRAGARAGLAAIFTSVAATAALATGLAPVMPNDNRHPAGVHDGTTRVVSLRAARGTWAPEGEGGPSVAIEALGEGDGPLQVPAPLLRVVEGTTLAVSIANELPAPLVVHGWCARGGTICPALQVPPGERRDVRFETGPAGTYHYWASTLGAPVPFRELGGAFIVDPAGGPPAADRVLVITEWSSLSAAELKTVIDADDAGEAFVKLQPGVAFMVNGRAWPATEHLHARLGTPERWRVVNLSSQPHPMHLHGFYFEVESAGDGLRDTRLAPDARRSVVTQLLPPGGTIAMTWTPEREGRWLFHCHVMDHVAPERRVGGARPPAADGHAHHEPADRALGMAGLVVGITVEPAAGPAAASTASAATDPVERRRRLTMELVSDALHGEPPTRYGVVLRDDDVTASEVRATPGPPLVLTRGEPVEIAVVNRLAESTSIHWHGMELDSVYDGVHGWSGAGERVAPMIAPGERVLVRFTPPRAGTFIYHTHLHDHRQLSMGLYGAMVVIEPSTAFDADRDHALVLGRRGLVGGPIRLMDDTTPVVLNGETAPRWVWAAGVTHRLRLVNITADDILVVSLQDAKGPVPWRLVAKDGATLAAPVESAGPARLTLAVGETADLEIDAPKGRGHLWLDVRSPAGRWEAQGHVVVR